MMLAIRQMACNGAHQPEGREAGGEREGKEGRLEPLNSCSKKFPFVLINDLEVRKWEIKPARKNKLQRPSYILITSQQKVAERIALGFCEGKEKKNPMPKILKGKKKKCCVWLLSSPSN